MADKDIMSKRTMAIEKSIVDYHWGQIQIPLNDSSPFRILEWPSNMREI